MKSLRKTFESIKPYAKSSTLHFEILGKKQGNFLLSESTQNAWKYSVESYADKQGIQRLFLPRCSFTTEIATLGEDDAPISKRIICTRKHADGGIVQALNVGIGIMVADCPSIVLFEERIGRFALLHGSFICLMPGNGNPGIITRAIVECRFKAFDTVAYVGFGIGPCCYGAEDKLMVQNSLVSKNPILPLGRATRGPRKGSTSIDLYELIRCQLVENGIVSENIYIDSRCTACANNEFYSHVYDMSEKRGNNFICAWLTEA